MIFSMPLTSGYGSARDSATFQPLSGSSCRPATSRTFTCLRKEATSVGILASSSWSSAKSFATVESSQICTVMSSGYGPNDGVAIQHVALESSVS